MTFLFVFNRNMRLFVSDKYRKFTG